MPSQHRKGHVWRDRAGSPPRWCGQPLCPSAGTAPARRVRRPAVRPAVRPAGNPVVRRDGANWPRAAAKKFGGFSKKIAVVSARTGLLVVVVEVALVVLESDPHCARHPAASSAQQPSSNARVTLAGREAAAVHRQRRQQKREGGEQREQSVHLSAPPPQPSSASPTAGSGAPVACDSRALSWIAASCLRVRVGDHCRRGTSAVL